MAPLYRDVKTENRPNLPPFCKRHFQMNFRKMNITFLSAQFKFSLHRLTRYWQMSIHTWTNGDAVHWRISASPSFRGQGLSAMLTVSGGWTLELLIWPQHCYGNAVIFMKFSSLATLEVYKMTTWLHRQLSKWQLPLQTNDGNFVKMTTVPFLWTLGMVDNRILQKCKHQR